MTVFHKKAKNSKFFLDNSDEVYYNKSMNHGCSAETRRNGNPKCCPNSFNEEVLRAKIKKEKNHEIHGSRKEG